MAVVDRHVVQDLIPDGVDLDPVAPVAGPDVVLNSVVGHRRGVRVLGHADAVEREAEAVLEDPVALHVVAGDGGASAGHVGDPRGIVALDLVVDDVIADQRLAPTGVGGLQEGVDRDPLPVRALVELQVVVDDVVLDQVVVLLL